MPQAGGAGRWERAATWIAAAAAAVFLAGLAVEFGDVVRAIYHNSDYASTPVIAELLGDKGSGAATLGNYLWIEPLYALRLTSWVPGHRHVWDLLPFLVYAVAILVFAWTLRRTVSGRSAFLGALALACPAPLVLALLGAPANRLPTLTHALILTAFLVGLPSLAGRSGWIRVLWAVGVAVILAPGVASDQLLLLWGVTPFVVAVVVGWRLALIAGRDATLAVGACVAGVLGGRLIVAVAHHHDFHKAAFPVKPVALDHLASNAKAVLEAIAQFVHGGFGVDGPYGVIAAAVAVAAMAAVPVFCVLVLRRLRGVLADDDRPSAQRLLLVFWAVCLLAIFVAVLGTDVTKGVSVVRYVLITWPALLALGLIVYRRQAFPFVAAMAALSAVLACTELVRGDYTETGQGLKEKEIGGLERFVAANRLDHGYAAYWDAAAITYLSKYRVRTYPVAVCGARGDGFCQFAYHTIDGWYAPKDGARTFLVYDKRDIPLSLKPAPGRWGRPFARARIGRLRVYAYDYDLASVLAEGSRPDAAELRRNERAAG